MKPRSRIPVRGLALLALAATLVVAGSVRAEEPASELSRAVEESYPTNLSMLRDAANAAVSEMLLNFNPPAGSSIRLEAENAHEARWFLENLLLDRLTEAGYEVYLVPEETPPATPKGPRARQAATGDERAEEDSADAAPTPSLADAMKASGNTPPPGEESFSPDSLAAVGDTVPEVKQEVEAATGRAADADTLAAPSVRRIPADYLLRFRVVECAVTYPKSYRKSPLGGRTVERLASVNVYATLVQESRERVVWVGHGDSDRLDHVPASKLPLLEGSTFPFTQPELESRGLGAYVEPILVLGIVAGLIYLFYSNQ